MFMPFLHPRGNFPVQGEGGKWEARSSSVFPRILGRVEKADVLAGGKMYCRERKNLKANLGENRA